MKILKIKIKNINCLRGEWEINFQTPPLSEAGLFAITGPTGSGKSTILDAITLALFNKIPRFESETISNTFIEKAGSIVTKNETDCFVEVDYRCSKGIFRSKWTIGINKRGNLRANDMELIDALTNKIIASGRRDVPNKNTELIGLTYDQFIKSILLSQGEFARFLKSKKDERGKLLEDITGMKVYRELGKRAFEKFKEKNEAIKSKTDIIDSEENQVLSKEKEEELDELIRTLNIEINSCEANRVAIEKAIEIKNHIQSIEKETENYIQEEERINKNLEVFNEKNAQRIFKHERLLPYLDQIRNYSAIYNSVKVITEEIKQEELELEEKRKEVGETLDATSKLIETKVDMQNADDVLTKFRDRVIYLMTNKINAEKALNDQKLKFSSHLKKLTLVQYKSYETSYKIKELQSKVSKELSDIASKTEDLIKKTTVTADNIITQKELLNAKLRRMEDLKLLVENYSENLKKLNKKKQEIKDTSELINNVEPRLEKTIELKNTVDLKITEVTEEREKKLLEEELEDQRKLLKHGDPCPLCGSLHHPYIHEYINNISDLTKELKTLKEEEKKFESEIYGMERQVHMHSGKLETLQKEMKATEEEMKEREIKITTRKKQLAIEKVGNLHTIEAAIAELDKSAKVINELEKSDATKRDLADFKEAVEELALRSVEFDNAKTELELRYKGNNIRGDCDLLGGQLRSLKEAIQRCETKLTSFKNQVEDFTRQQNIIDSSIGASISSFNYSDILSAFADILSGAEFNNLKQQLADLEGIVKSVKALIRGADVRKKELLINDDTNKAKEQLLENLHKTEQQIKEDKKNLDENRSQQMQNESRKKTIIKLKQQVDETRQANLKWELLCKYIGDASGKNFSTFAQGLTLKKLILLTNERLRKLNDRYLLDVPLKEEDDDLIIIDRYLGEERRSVKTLSGGETFIVSLALALALSDLASKNVKIESLYIDEGFGSLDQEALGVAISTLEQLQEQSNKTIGIISHIDWLKETIETQIQLEKNSTGFSKIIVK